MLQEVQQIFLNPLWTLAALVITIAAVIISIIFYLKGRKVRKPTYYIRSHNLVADLSSRLNKQLFYGDASIVNLTVSRVGFWNAGAETIEWGNTVESDPIRIESIGDCDILDANVIKEINTINKFRVDLISKRQVNILFNFLDKGQGGAIQVIHTGKGNSDIKIDGFIKGAGKPVASYTKGRVIKVLDKIFSQSKQPQPTKPQPAKVRRSMAIFSFFAALMMLLIVFSQDAISDKLFGVVSFIIYAYFGYILLKRRVPKGLEIIEEEEI